MTRHSKPPMTADEAREIVAEMRKATAHKTRLKFWQTAIRIGNLSQGAKDVYAQAIAHDRKG